MWLVVEINLGVSLALIAFSDHGSFTEAILILRRALSLVPSPDIELRTRASLGLAKALMFSGKENERASELNEAISIFNSLLQVEDPLVRREAKNNLGMAFYFLGVATEDRPSLRIACAVLSAAIDADDMAACPFVHAQTQVALGQALREIGRLEKSASDIDSSIERLQGCLTVASKGEAPMFRAAVQTQLASSYLERARLDHNPSSFASAQELIEEALFVLGPNTRGPLTAEALEVGRKVHLFGEEVGTTIRSSIGANPD